MIRGRVFAWWRLLLFWICGALIGADVALYCQHLRDGASVYPYAMGLRVLAMLVVCAGLVLTAPRRR